MRQLIVAIAGVWVLLVGGCTPAPASDDGRSADRNEALVAPRNGGRTSNDPSIAPHAGVAQASATIATEARGAVPYNRFTLPIISPDGRFIATQSGDAPTWAVTLARDDARPVTRSRVEIYRIPDEESDPPLVSVVREPVILGRGCDEHGVLVESPRDDGSRWIGRADWVTGEVTWLVSDTHVNAFGSISPDGRLAWSRRPAGADHFELVVQRLDGTRWTQPADGGDWLMPTWGGAEGHLFVLQLQDEFLDARHGDPTSRSTFARGTRTSIATKATIDTAFQTLSGQAGPPTVADDDTLLFYHPARNRMALWRPASNEGAMMLEERSFNATLGDGGFVLVTTERELRLQHVTERRERVRLVNGLQIARRIDGTTFSYLLLAPGENAIVLTALAVVHRAVDATN